jgi:hypothetical protein
MCDIRHQPGQGPVMADKAGGIRTGTGPDSKQKGWWRIHVVDWQKSHEMMALRVLASLVRREISRCSSIGSDDWIEEESISSGWYNSGDCSECLDLTSTTRCEYTGPAGHQTAAVAMQASQASETNAGTVLFLPWKLDSNEVKLLQ